MTSPDGAQAQAVEVPHETRGACGLAGCDRRQAFARYFYFRRKSNEGTTPC